MSNLPVVLYVANLLLMMIAMARAPKTQLGLIGWWGIASIIVGMLLLAAIIAYNT